MASSSRPSTALPSASATPAPSSPPPPSESFLSDIDGTAPSVLDVSGEFQWDAGSSGHGLNLVSWKKGVEEGDEGVDKRGFYDGKANQSAISTVLNHPTKKANPLRSTRKPLPPLGPAPALPRPPPATHFDDYLKAVTPLYDTLAQQAASGSKTSEHLTGAFDTQTPRPADIPPLDSIPDIYFSRDFDLANPSIWSEVVEAGPSRLRPNVSIQDDMSSHLDTLERHLIHEITLRSTSFFSALSNLQDLHSESASCLRRISDLQAGLRDVGENQARKGLKILDRMEDLRILRVTEAGMGEMQQVEEVMAVAKGLVEGGDWAGGLSCAADVVIWWERHRPQEEDKPPDPLEEDDDLELGSPHLPLSTLPAFAAIPLAISDLITQIALQLESALQSYLLSTLSAAELDTPYDKERFRDHLIPIVEGLVRCGAGDAVEGVWREVVTLAVREGSRKHLPIAQPEDEGDENIPQQEMRGATLASALKSMDHSRYLLLTTQMYQSILARLRLAQTIGPDLSAILSASSNLPPLRITSNVPTTSTEVFDPLVAEPLSIDNTDIIASACELGNLRASKILAVRGEQHAGLGINEFVELFKENWEFVLATEGMAQRMIVSLRGMTASQARTFLIAYHSQRLTKSAKLVEEEQWNQIDAPSSVQHNVNILIEAAVSDPPECFIPPRQPVLNGHSQPEVNGAAGAKALDIEDKKFFLVQATAETISLLKDYLGVVVNLEVVVTDVMARIIEFLKVVLGAGAMRSAGLKNITAKHLALASQSLSIIVALIPYIREFIRRHLNPKQAVMLTEFDKLKRDYQEHQNEIHAKLVAIMSDRLAVHVGSLRDIEWEAAPEKDGPRAYAELLVKETATLHKVLSKYLAISTVETVMSEVLAAITHRLSEEYAKIELKSDDAKKRMTQDASLIVARLTHLSEAGKTVSSLEVLVKDKPVPRKNLIGNLLKRGTMKEGGAAAGDASVAAEGDQGEDDEVGEEEEDGPTVTSGPEQMADAAEASTGTRVEGLPDAAPLPEETQEKQGTEPAAKASSETPRDSTETMISTVSTAATSVPDPVEMPSAEAIPTESKLSSEDAPPLPEKETALPAQSSSPPTESWNSAAEPIHPPQRSSSIPPPPVKSPSPIAKSPPSSIISPPNGIRSPPPISSLPASPSPAPASSSNSPATIRAPRVSLANRLRGVITRTGSVDRDTEPVRSPSPVQNVRRSIEGLRRSLEGERPVMSGISTGIEGLSGGTAPATPTKSANKGDESETSARKENPKEEISEIVSPVPQRLPKDIMLPDSEDETDHLEPKEMAGKRAKQDHTSPKESWTASTGDAAPEAPRKDDDRGISKDPTLS